MEQQPPSLSCLNSVDAAGKRNFPLGFGALLLMLLRKDGLEARSRMSPRSQNYTHHPGWTNLLPLRSLLLFQSTAPLGKIPLLHSRKQLQMCQIYKCQWLSPSSPSATARNTAGFTLKPAHK